MEKVLLIFVRNPDLGKVKTRLAATVSDENALKIYRELLRHTRSITEKLPVLKMLYYAEGIPENDLWPKEIYEKKTQVSGDLGNKMQAAFQAVFAGGASKVILIGSDCYELTSEMLEQAFNALVNHDAVIGPAEDGGYYLIGFSRPDYTVFANKTWSTDSVLRDTVNDLESNGFSYFTLPVLNDVDEEKDLGPLRCLLNSNGEMKEFILETERLALREITPADARSMYELNLDPEVIRYTGDPPFASVEDAEKFIRNYPDYAKNGYGRWAVIRKADGETLGWCGLKFLPETNETDIGYRFFKKYWGHGYATEAAQACLQFGFEKLGLETIVARAMHENIASINVMKKLGMTYWKEVDCEAEPAVCYKMIKAEFSAKNNNLVSPKAV